MLSFTTAQLHADKQDDARNKMVNEAVIGAGVKDSRVIRSMRSTPRHEFVEPKFQSKAYLDMALPIGDSQTISSPFIVAFMTEALDPQASDRVLEIGTGSGYQAAILSPLVKEVYSIEIVRNLGDNAKRTLTRLGYENIQLRIGDGYKGWSEHAPFDKIIVTCSPESIPQPLIDQLKEGGTMIIPVGERYRQSLYLLRKENGKLRQQSLRPTLFVPMTGDAEEARQRLPDGEKPEILNGGFEAEPNNRGFMPVWYYQRHVRRETGGEAPEGNVYASMTNDVPGRSAHFMQGFAIDGEKIRSLKLSADVRVNDVENGPGAKDVPLVLISFFDADRKDLGVGWLGPFRGTSKWRTTSRVVAVPPLAREAIIQIGLFGATGRFDVDDVSIEPINR